MFALFRSYHGFVILAAAAGLVLAAVQCVDLYREVEQYNRGVKDPLRDFRFRHRAPSILLIILAVVLLASLILPS